MFKSMFCILKQIIKQKRTHINFNNSNINYIKAINNKLFLNIGLKQVFLNTDLEFKQIKQVFLNIDLNFKQKKQSGNKL